MKITQTGAADDHGWDGIGLVDAEFGGQKSDFGVSLFGSQADFGVGKAGEGGVGL
ncbi:MAG: hypothetical protein U5R06_17005 [candidate division KSB1 bacterium]|nr:hypothetical protein [candidate division KSB1 bacterium]